MLIFILSIQVDMTKTRTNPTFIPSSEMIKHKDAVIKLLTILTGNRNIEETFIQHKHKKGGTDKMSGVFDDVFDRLRAEGEIKGKAYGMISVYLENGLAKPDIMDKLIQKLSITTKQAETYYDDCMKK